MADGTWRYPEIALGSVPTPPTGKLFTFVDAADKHLKQKDDTGAVTDLTAGGVGVASGTLSWEYDGVSTTDADPGAGFVRFNSLTLNAATQMYISEQTFDGIDVPLFLERTLLKGDFIVIQSASDPTNVMGYQLASNATDQTGYWRVDLDFVSESGSFSDGVIMLISPTPIAAKTETAQSTTPFAFTSTTFTVIPDTEVTPEVGDYMVHFLSSAFSGTKNQNFEVSIFKNGVEIVESRIEASTNQTASQAVVIGSTGLTTADGTDVFDVRARRVGGSGSITFQQRQVWTVEGTRIS